MIDFETDLRDRFDAASAEVSASPDLLRTVERRIARAGRRAAVARVAAIVAVLAVAAGSAVALSADDPDGPTRAADPSDPAITDGPATTIPLTPGWATVADAPIAGRFSHVTLAMDDEVLVWGGGGFDGQTTPTGAVYDVATDTWRTIPPPDDLTASAIGVWTGEVALLVGGPEEGGAGDRTAAAFDPATDTWTTLATPPVGTVADAVTHAVWTGDELAVVSGGFGGVGAVAIYDPAADEWREAALPPTPLPSFADVVWTGDEVVVVGFDSGVGDQASSVNGDLDGDGDLRDPGDPPEVPESPTVGQSVVLAYDLAADTWRSIPWGLPAGPRGRPAAVWTGDRLFVGGGTGGDQRTDAALLDLATGTWTPVADAPASFSSSGRHPGIWTGSSVIVSSASIEEPLRFLAFDPAAGTWTESPAAPVARPEGAAPVWSAGRVVLALGGEATIEPDGSGFCCDHGPAGGVTYTP